MNQTIMKTDFEVHPARKILVVVTVGGSTNSGAHFLREISSNLSKAKAW
jgi:hypothetical protein